MGNAPSIPMREILQKQSIPKPGEEKQEGEGHIMIMNPDVLGPYKMELGKTDTGFEVKDGIKTCWDIFQRGTKGFPKKNMLSTRIWQKTSDSWERGEYKAETYEAVEAKVLAVGRGLVAHGLTSSSRCGMFSNNRAEWIISALGCYSQSMTVVSLYATLGAEAVEYIMNHAELEAIFVSNQELKTVLKNLKARSEKKSEDQELVPLNLKLIVQWDHDEVYGNEPEKVAEEDVKFAKEFGVTLMGFTELRKAGEGKQEIKISPPKENDLAYLMYTSGTTGVPKGAMLSHSNIAKGASNLAICNSSDRHISYLPLAHIFESMIEFNLMLVGASIYYFQGDIRKLTEDILAVRPTIFAGVPRVYNKFYDKIFSGVQAASWLKKTVFNKGYNAQVAAIRNRRPRSAYYDRKIFIPLREAKLGLDQCRICITGAAPCPAWLFEFIQVVIGANVVQGYGMTENTACATLMIQDDGRGGHNGPPVPNVEVKLVDVPEMGYLSTDELPRGEVCTRSPMNFQGYFKNDEETKKALVGEWLFTGDIGRWNKDGTLSIIDRRKNIFKLSQGEYIAVEKVESAYNACNCVGQVWVYGNSYKPIIVAVVVPEALWVQQFATSKKWWKSGAAPGSDEFRQEFKRIIEDADMRKVIIAAMQEQMKVAELDAKLNGFEKVKGIHLESEIDATLAGFTVENDLITPTFKLKRPNLKDRYLKQLKQLYTDLNEAPKEEEEW